MGATLARASGGSIAGGPVAGPYPIVYSDTSYVNTSPTDGQWRTEYFPQRKETKRFLWGYTYIVKVAGALTAPAVSAVDSTDSPACFVPNPDVRSGSVC